MDDFTRRINYSGDLSELAALTCEEFHLGKFADCKLIAVGYEDFNFKLETSKGKFFVKIFSAIRTLDECKNIVEIMKKAMNAGVSVPKLYKSKKGFLSIIKIKKQIFRICVMDYIEGGDLFSSKEKLTVADINVLAKQTALINSIDFKFHKLYDEWAIENFLKEYKKKSKYLEEEDLELIQPILRTFKELKIEKLHRCFVHGDILKTNIIKDKKGRLWIFDFSVANNYPRVQEFAVLACDVLFNKKSKQESEQNLKLFLAEYQKKTKLSSAELEALPVYVKLAHAMHVLCATYEKKVNKNKSKENEYFLALGEAGLRQ